MISSKNSLNMSLSPHHRLLLEIIPTLSFDALQDLDAQTVAIAHASDSIQKIGMAQALINAQQKAIELCFERTIRQEVSETAYLMLTPRCDGFYRCSDNNQFAQPISFHSIDSFFNAIKPFVRFEAITKDLSLRFFGVSQSGRVPVTQESLYLFQIHEDINQQLSKVGVENLLKAGVQQILVDAMADYPFDNDTGYTLAVSDGPTQVLQFSGDKKHKSPVFIEVDVGHIATCCLDLDYGRLVDKNKVFDIAKQCIAFFLQDNQNDISNNGVCAIIGDALSNTAQLTN